MSETPKTSADPGGGMDRREALKGGSGATLAGMVFAPKVTTLAMTSSLSIPPTPVDDVIAPATPNDDITGEFCKHEITVVNPNCGEGSFQVGTVVCVNCTPMGSPGDCSNHNAMGSGAGGNRTFRLLNATKDREVCSGEWVRANGGAAACVTGCALPAIRGWEYSPNA